MAPPSGATGKAGVGGGSRPLRKPVVPVVPLPFTQRQQQQQQRQRSTLRPTAASHAAAAPAVPQPRDNPISNHNHAEPQKKENHYQESQVALVDNDARKNGAREESPTGQGAEEEAATPSAARAKVTPTSPTSPPPASPGKNGIATPTAPSVHASSQQHTAMASPTPTRPRAPPAFQQSNEALGNPSAAPSFVSQVAAPHQPHMGTVNQYRMHQAHPSNSSLVFGGFRDSNTSSPAPRSGGAYRLPDRTSYQPEAMPMPAMDNYGRPMLASPTVDGYPPALMNHHGPPTPHSFHGSQSSMHAEENGFVHYPVMNGHNGYPTHPISQPQQHMPAIDPHMGTLQTVAGGPSGFGISRMQFQTLDFLRGGIEHAEFSDCTLEVHIIKNSPSTDLPGPQSSQAPLRIPCHRFVLAQSPTLKHILQTRGTSPDGVLRLELQDNYLRPEAFYFSIRTLYGWDFGDHFLPTYLSLQGIKDEFDLALGYAAAAKYLQLPLVHAKAIRYAWRRLLHWETIEQACAFALPSAIFGYPVRHDLSSPTADHFSVAELLDGIMAFIVNRLPPNFTLDTTVGDCGFSRLPLSSPVAPTRAMPAIAHGMSGPGRGSHSRHASSVQAQMPRNPRFSANPRLSQIQFGDLGVAGPGDQGTAAVAVHLPTPGDAILSRILLNLPFSLLKQVLEHPALGKAAGELSNQARHDLISNIIAEREARRLRAVADTHPQVKPFQERLDGTVEPLPVHQMGDFLVNSMGFKEEVFPGDVPYLVQRWVHSGSGSISA